MRRQSVGRPISRLSEPARPAWRLRCWRANSGSTRCCSTSRTAPAARSIARSSAPVGERPANSPLGADYHAGRPLAEALRASRVRYRPGMTVWHIDPGGAGGDGAVSVVPARRQRDDRCAAHPAGDRGDRAAGTDPGLDPAGRDDRGRGADPAENGRSGAGRTHRYRRPGPAALSRGDPAGARRRAAAHWCSKRPARENYAAACGISAAGGRGTAISARGWRWSPNLRRLGVPMRRGVRGLRASGGAGSRALPGTAARSPPITCCCMTGSSRTRRSAWRCSSRISGTRRNGAGAPRRRMGPHKPADRRGRRRRRRHCRGRGCGADRAACGARCRASAGPYRRRRTRPPGGAAAGGPRPRNQRSSAPLVNMFKKTPEIRRCARKFGNWCTRSNRSRPIRKPKKRWNSIRKIGR